MTDPLIPEATVMVGFMVRCADDRCGELVFSNKQEDAEKIRDNHVELHRRHIETVAKYQKEILDAQDAGKDTAGGVQRIECPRCRAGIGMPHHADCDVARCIHTGAQRVYRDHMIVDGGIMENHDCGRDVWTGFYPGEKEALDYGVPLMVLKELGYWDADAVAWKLPEGWEQVMHERGLGPAISGA